MSKLMRKKRINWQGHKGIINIGQLLYETYTIYHNIRLHFVKQRKQIVYILDVYSKNNTFTYIFRK